MANRVGTSTKASSVGVLIAGSQGPTITSAATIVVTDSVHEVTGSTDIATINGGQSNQLLFLYKPTGATWNLLSTGNITDARTIYEEHIVCLLTLDGTTWRYVFAYPASITDIDEISFDTTYGDSNPPAAGSINWTDTDGTLQIGMKGGNVVQQVGLESYVKGLNKTGVQINNGQVCYLSGAQGNRPTIALADADAAEPLHYAVGIATEDIGNNAEGYVTVLGFVRGLNTSAFNDGDRLFLDTTPGGLTNSEPSPPNESVVVGVCVYSHSSNGIIHVQPNNHIHWADLDTRYVEVAGDTMTGLLKADGGITFEGGSNYGAYVDSSGQGSITFAGVPIPSIHNGDIEFIVDVPATGTSYFKVLSTGTADQYRAWIGPTTRGALGVKAYGLSSEEGFIVEGSGSNQLLDINHDGTGWVIESRYHTSGSYHPLAFLTGGSTRLLIDASGNVGIGATTVQAPLHVRVDQSRTALTGATRGLVHLWAGDDFTAGDITAITFGGGSGGDAGAISIIGQQIENTGSNLFFGTGNAWGQVTNTAMLIDHNGNVGIGKTAPASKLDIADTNKSTAQTANLNIATTDAQAIDVGATLDLGGQADVSVGFARLYGRKENATAGNRSGYFAVSTYENGVGHTERMRIDSSGDVGIGATPTVSRLESIVSSGSTVAGLFGTAPSGSSGNVYIRGQFINASYGYAGNDGALGLNYTGYLNSTGAYRDVIIYDGKTAQIMQVQGSTASVGIGATPSKGKLHVERARSDSAGDTAIGFGQVSYWGFRDNTSNSMAVDYYNGATWTEHHQFGASGEVALGRAINLSQRLVVESMGVSNYMINCTDSSGNQLIGMNEDSSGHGNIYIRDSAASIKISLLGGTGEIIERGRSYAIGVSQTWAGATSKGTHGGGSTWTGGTYTSRFYTRTGLVTSYNLSLTGSTIGSVAANYLTLNLDFATSAQTSGIFIYVDTGGRKFGWWYTTGSTLVMYPQTSGGTFPIGSLDLYLQFETYSAS